MKSITNVYTWLILLLNVMTRLHQIYSTIINCFCIQSDQMFRLFMSKGLCSVSSSRDSLLGKLVCILPFVLQVQLSLFGQIGGMWFL